VVVDGAAAAEVLLFPCVAANAPPAAAPAMSGINQTFLLLFASTGSAFVCEITAEATCPFDDTVTRI
jgi:hypothetical protein